MGAGWRMWGHSEMTVRTMGMQWMQAIMLPSPCPLFSPLRAPQPAVVALVVPAEPASPAPRLEVCGGGAAAAGGGSA